MGVERVCIVKPRVLNDGLWTTILRQGMRVESIGVVVSGALRQVYDTRSDYMGVETVGIVESRTLSESDRS